MNNKEIEVLLMERFELAEKGAEIIERIRKEHELTIDDCFLVFLKDEPECADIVLNKLAEWVKYREEIDVRKINSKVCVLTDCEKLGSDPRIAASGIDTIVVAVDNDMMFIKEYIQLSKYGRFVLCSINFPKVRTGKEIIGYKGTTLKDLVLCGILGMPKPLETGGGSI